ncbi:MAG: hypothetical protein ACI4QY_03935 [Oscillospiraceae bacterium]
MEVLEETSELEVLDELAGLEMLEETTELEVLDELSGLELLEEATELEVLDELSGLELLEETTELEVLDELAGSLEEASEPDEIGRLTVAELLLADDSKSELSDELSGSEEFNELSETEALDKSTEFSEFPEVFPILFAVSTLLQPESIRTPAASKAERNTLIFFIL